MGVELSDRGFRLLPKMKRNLDDFPLKLHLQAAE